ncbi:MAG: hypothetical protein JW795_02615 [Chitinivibrionales bacterium]|nr:hypothetical protein [Chitinivibrionales bacterium]
MTIKKSFYNILPIVLGGIILASSFDVCAARLGIKRQSQRMDQWCWAASSSMILEHYGFIKTQEDIVRAAFGSLKNQGGTDKEIIPALSNNGVPSKNVTSITEANVKLYGDERRTFMFAWLWTSGGGHALVYDGYEGSQYYVVDPWQNTATQAFSYASLKNAGGKGRWGYSYLPEKGATEIKSIAQKNQTPVNFTCYNVKNGIVSFNLDPSVTYANGSITIYNGRGVTVKTINVSPNQSIYQLNVRSGLDQKMSNGVYFAVLKLNSSDNTTNAYNLKFAIN